MILLSSNIKNNGSNKQISMMYRLPTTMISLWLPKLTTKGGGGGGGEVISQCAVTDTQVNLIFQVIDWLFSRTEGWTCRTDPHCSLYSKKLVLLKLWPDISEETQASLELDHKTSRDSPRSQISSRGGEEIRDFPWCHARTMAEPQLLSGHPPSFFGYNLARGWG